MQTCSILETNKKMSMNNIVYVMGQDAWGGKAPTQDVINDLISGV